MQGLSNPRGKATTTMNRSALLGNRGMIYLCLILSLALSLQGAPPGRSAHVQKSGWNSALEDPIHPKPSKKVGIPLLPPDENMKALSLQKGKEQPHGPPEAPDYEEVDVSGDGQLRSGETEGISGDGSIDYLDFHFPFPVEKPATREFGSQGNAE